ncbi:prolipoprotein diacylglyceryl transferase family protein, partial [Gemmiger formicilis]|uniref:prolipoprotein diacylglyceryl transferase family protein n=2 Tax=Eubacteriales TaxID=186802 RepID=UPI003C6CFD8F
LAIYGGVIAGFLTAYLFSRRRKISFWALADCCVQGLFIGQAIGRWGNFMNREAFGAATELPWRMRLWTSATTYMDVHPTFL